MGLSFEWDAKKVAINKNKHGVLFEEASTVFGDPLSLMIEDPLNSIGEERFIIIGKSNRQRTIVVVYAERGNKIRIISARLATLREKKTYEKGN
ncbi:MAG: BrnT family toxin [Xenococcus sp. (in: cyanobacteria)]